MPALLPEELACVERAVLVRQLDFAAGRVLARSALEALGVRGFALVGDPAGAPRWPAHIAGSITHTRRVEGGFAGVVAAPKSTARSLGIDAESEDGLTEELWPSVLRDEERARLARLPASERLAAASLIFSAKECYYKLQYALTGQFLDFMAATIEDDAASGTFAVVVRQDAGTAFRTGDVLQGRFVRRDGLIVTGMLLPA
jgi:4'-phosphopantetheinyl transferase EntD